jgi:hypothetical protein
MSENTQITAAPYAFGLHDGIPSAIYHADQLTDKPSLSSGLARKILDQSLAHAHLGHPRLGGGKSESTAAMSLGSLVHALLAGENSEIEIGNFDSFRGKAAQEWRDTVKSSGRIPALEKDLDEARLIVAAITANAANGISNTPYTDAARNEVTAIWLEGDAPCRARFDRLLIDPNGYADVWDWKTTTDISERAIVRTICEYGYHIQAAFYLRGLAACLPSHKGRLTFTFVFVETTAPYAVRRVCLSAEFMAVGAREASKAIRLWSQALATNEWADTRSLETLHAQAPTWMDDDEINIG